MKMYRVCVIVVVIAVLISVVNASMPDEPGMFVGGIKVVDNDCSGVAPPLGDLNGDCKIDYFDIVIIAESWLMVGAA